MFANRIAPGPIEDGLDRKHLTTIKRRFLEINGERLARTRDDLAERQRIFLDLLPLLFHVNHPMLPGYISQDAPSGIVHYQPSDDTLQKAKTFARSFRHHRNHNAPACIEAIFMMGSVGTIAYNRKSDLDIWVCHSADLPREAIRQLNIRCQLICDWATQLGLETHFFLMNATEFCAGKNHSLSQEASGETQHFLLLDEFYRSGILVAGKQPIWWFVPSNFEQDYPHYTHTLISKRFIADRDLIDLGQVDTIPESEFIGAGVWQLYKAIESPYKSVLKLLLLEIYASESPQVKALSLDFKQRLYDGELDINKLDPYVLCYQRIEDYLTSRRELDRLALARRCFYFKINKPLTKRFTGAKKSWQRLFLESLVKEWSWSDKYLEFLDNKPNWNAKEVIAERRIVVKELNRSYQALLAFERKSLHTSLKNNQDLSILGRKLAAYYERKPGKIDCINFDGATNVNEDALFFIETADATSPQWLLSTAPITIPSAETGDNESADSEHGLKQSGSLVELMLWAYRNEILTNATALHVLSDENQSTAAPRQEPQLFELYDVIAKWLPLPLPRVSHEAYFQPPFTTDVLVLVNVNSQPKTTLSERGIHRIGGSDDALNYGALNDSLVLDIELVTRNNWNELSCFQFRDTALPQCLSFLLQQLRGEAATDLQPPRVVVHCFTPQMGSLIKQRVMPLLTDILLLQGNSANPIPSRYIFSERNHYYCCEGQGSHYQVVDCATEEDLMQQLAQPSDGYQAIALDDRTQTAYPLALLANVSQQEAIHVIFSPRGQCANLYVLDERGAFFTYQTPYLEQQILLAPLHRFIRNIIAHRAEARESDLELPLSNKSATPQDIRALELQHFGVYPVKFYRHVFDDLGEEILVPCHPSTDTDQLGFSDLRIAARVTAQQHLEFVVHCGARQFTSARLDDEILQQVQDYLSAEQAAEENLPCYVTDIDFSVCPEILMTDTTPHCNDYLRIKAQIEARLNSRLNLL